MKLRLLLMMAMSLVLGADAPKEDPAAKALQQFQGTWTLESVEVNGMKIDAPAMKQAGHEITLRLP